jgi:hypothetical protein
MKLEMEQTYEYPVAYVCEVGTLRAEVRYAEYIEDYFNPREHCNVGHMLCSHPHYNLGDEQVSNGIDTAVTCGDCDGSGYIEGLVEIPGGEDTCAKCEGEGEVRLSYADYFRVQYGATVVLPLYLYDHSGLAMSCGQNMLPDADERAALSRRGRFMGDDAGWDTSTVGFIFDTTETREETGCPLDRIEEALRAEVDHYDDYLRGNCYDWSLIDTETGDYIDSCTGFVGDEDAKYAAEQALDALKAERSARINAKRKETINRKWAAERDIITVDA